MMDPVPDTLWHKLKEFMTAQKSGHFTLHINAGEVKGYEITEKGKIKDIMEATCTHGEVSDPS